MSTYRPLISDVSDEELFGPPDIEGDPVEVVPSVDRGAVLTKLLKAVTDITKRLDVIEHDLRVISLRLDHIEEALGQ